MNFPNPFKTHSLSNRLAISLSIVLVFFGGAALWLYSYLSTYQASLDLGFKSQEYLSAISETLTFPLWDVDEPKIKAVCSAYAKNDLISVIKVIGSDGYLYFSLTKPNLTTMKLKTVPIILNGENMGTLTLGLTTDYYNVLHRQFFWFYTSSLLLMILTLTLIINILLRKLLRSPHTEFVKMVESYALGDEEAFKGQISYVEFKPFIKAMTKMGNTINQQIKSLKLIQHAIDHSVISTYWFDRQGHVIYANESACRTSGFTQEEMLTLSIKDLILDGPVDEKQGQMHSPDNAGPTFFESIQLKKDGTTFPVEVVANYFKYHQEDFIFAFVTDIRERKKTEEELRKSENKYRTMIESMPEPVYICSPEYKVEFMNAALIKHTGRNAVGEDCYSALYDFHKKCDWCIFDRLNPGDVIETNIVIPKDNRTFRVTNIPIKNKDESVSQLSILRDITDYLKALSEEEKAKTLLLQSQKMESIGNLAGGIAHDFNNILSAILGYTELALNHFEKGLNVNECLQEVYAAGKRARDLVKQILTFARQVEEEQKPIQVDMIVKELLNFIRSTIPASIEIRQNIESNSLIIGNPTQVHQIFMNLCTNAAQAMEDTGGVLEVSLSDVEINKQSFLLKPGLAPGKYMVASVSDTGPGIKSDIIQSIFEPYFTTKEAGKGTGMGLSLVHSIIEAYGGKIFVDSDLGKGTTFSVYFPIVKKVQSDGLHEEKKKLPSGTERILFIDDEPPIAKIVSHMMEQLGYSVIYRTSSIEALELFCSKPDDFDLVITDMTMPNMTGDKLAVEMMAIRPDIPIILCTGYSSKISNENAAEFGIKGFLYKPILTEELAKTIRKVLDKQKADFSKRESFV